MNEHLEQIAVADEDGRAQVEAARAAADGQVAAARVDCAARAQQAAAARQHLLETELKSIQDTTDRILGARRSARDSYAEARRRVADPYVAEAAGVYARIVRGDAPPRRVT